MKQWLKNQGLEMAAQWSRLAKREQTGVQAALALLVMATLWVALVSPAWQTWRSHKVVNAQLDLQLSQMHSLALEAKTLSAKPKPDAQQLGNWLASLRGSGKTTVEISPQTQNNSYRLQVSHLDSATLANWLVTARTVWGLRLTQLNLTKEGVGKEGANKDAAWGQAQVRYSGTWVWEKQ